MSGLMAQPQVVKSKEDALSSPLMVVLPDIVGCGKVTLHAGCSDYHCYDWSTGGSQTPAIDVDSSGVYTVQVGYDLNGDGECDFYYSKQFNVTIYPVAQVDLGSDKFSCDGIPILLDAGEGLVSYIWNTGDAARTIMVDTSGVYSVTVTDSNGCQASDEVVIDISESIKLASSSTKKCDGRGTAMVEVVSGGPPPYTVLWSDGQTTSTAVGLIPGKFTVTVTDANGCSAVEEVIVKRDDYCTTVWNCDQVPENLNQLIAALKIDPEVDMYKFTFWDMFGTVVDSIEGNGDIYENIRTASLADSKLTYNSCYQVTVAASIDGGQTYYSDSAPCHFCIGEPMTGIYKPDCNSTYTSLSRHIRTSSVVVGADMYRFTFSYQGTSTTIESNNSTGTVISVPLSEANLTCGRTYTVSVAVSLDGGESYYSESETCEIYIAEEACLGLEEAGPQEQNYPQSSSGWNSMINQPEVTIYPNPSSSGKIRIIFEHTSANPDITYGIVDLSGRVIRKPQKGVETQELDIADLQSGVYLIKAVVDGYLLSQKIIIE